MNNEIIMPIQGYEGLYTISNQGYIKFCDKQKGSGVKIREGVKKASDNGCGYLSTGLTKNGISTTFYVHILVAKHFIPNPKNLPEVNHKDGNKSNCAAYNLEWTDRKGNEEHAWRTGLKSTLTVWNSKKVYQFSLKGEFIKEWINGNEVQRQLGFHGSVIRRCCASKISTAYGFKWFYVKPTDLPR